MSPGSSSSSSGSSGGQGGEWENLGNGGREAPAEQESHVAEVQVGGSWAAWVEVEGNEAELMSLGSWKIGSKQDVLVCNDGAGGDGSIIDSDSDSNDEGILELMEWRYTEESSSEEEDEELDQEQGQQQC